MTVNKLIEYLSSLKECGDYKIKIGDHFLFEDEIGVIHNAKEIKIHGCMYHEDIAQKVTVFQKKIEEAYIEFYGNLGIGDKE